MTGLGYSSKYNSVMLFGVYILASKQINNTSRGSKPAKESKAEGG
jgi:hypothetical protein